MKNGDIGLRFWTRSARTLCAVIICSALVCGCKPRKKSGGPPAMPPAAVTANQPVEREIMDWDVYPGRVAAVEMVEVRARVNGYLESIHFKDGAEVKKGDLLFVIDPRPFQAELDQAKANLIQARTRLELASNDLARAERLLNAKAISEEQADTRSKARREAEAAVTAAQALVQAAQLNLSYTQVTAPVAGRIGRKLITEGNLVAGGQSQSTLLTTIVSMDPVYCYFDADERAVLRYMQTAGRGQDGNLQQPNIPCELQLANESDFPHKGLIDFVDNQVDPRTGTLRLRGIFENPQRKLQPGFFCRARVPATKSYRAMLLPDEAVGTDQSQKFVYVVTDQDAIDYRVVKVGTEHNGMRVIREGLKTNEWVVVNGLMSVRPGAKVAPKRIVPGAPAAAAAPSTAAAK